MKLSLLARLKQRLLGQSGAGVTSPTRTLSLLKQARLKRSLMKRSMPKLALLTMSRMKRSLMKRSLPKLALLTMSRMKLSRLKRSSMSSTSECLHWARYQLILQYLNRQCGLL